MHFVWESQRHIAAVVAERVGDLASVLIDSKVHHDSVSPCGGKVEQLPNAIEEPLLFNKTRSFIDTTAWRRNVGRFVPRDRSTTTLASLHTPVSRLLNPTNIDFIAGVNYRALDIKQLTPETPRIMLPILAIVLLVALLAFANGANDNCKGVATLVGFGAATPRQGLAWAAASTAIGAAVSFWFAGGLLKSFSTGLFAPGTSLDAAFFIAVLIGAFGWVIFATFTGLPVSTTHAITGALVGAGLVAFSAGQLQWGDLGKKFALPLALSPLLSLSVVYAAAWPVMFVIRRVADRCLCVVPKATIAADPAGQLVAGCETPNLDVVADTVENCAAAAPVAVASGARIATGVHWLSGGLVGFARGWNDAPKIAALSVAALVRADSAHGAAWAFAVTTLAMAAGGLFAGRRVLETLAKKVTPLPLAESLTASVATASLVSAACWFGLPVSTTHVSTGAIVGAGLKNNPRAVHWNAVGGIVLSWFVTLPVAGLLSATACWLIR